VLPFKRQPPLQPPFERSGNLSPNGAAMPAFQEAIAKHDPLRAVIEPIEAKATPENSASYQWSPGSAL
jgi:hypothetical protein